MSVRAAGNTFLAAGLELLASNDDSSQGGGEVKGRTAPAPVPVGQRSAAGGGLNVVSSTVVVATVSFRVATRVIKRRKCNVWCLGLCSTMFQGSHCCIFAGQARASCRKNLLPGCLSVSFACQTESSRVESTCINHTSPRQKSIATILPVKQNNRGQKSLAPPTCQARGWRSVAICHRIQHRANLHNGPAMATCHKGLPKAPCLVLAHGLAGRKRWIFQTITVIHVLYLCKQYNTATTVPRYTHLSSTGSMMMARH